MRALGFRHPEQPVAEIDLVFTAPFPFSELKGRAVTVAYRDLELPVVSVPDLVAMKEASGRGQDRSDAEALRSLGKKDA